MTRSGLRISSATEVQNLAALFSQCHCVHLPRFLEPSLLDTTVQALASARFSERVHETLSPPTIDLRLDDPAVHGLLLVVFNDAALFKFVESVSGCRPVRLFHGTAYRMVPGVHHLDSWHSDLDENRAVALSLNLSSAEYRGGVLQIRTLRPPTIVHEVANTGFGDAVLFGIADGLEHRLTPIGSGPDKLAWAGWFCHEPSFLDVLHGRGL